jgi:hypothetical protein
VKRMKAVLLRVFVAIAVSCPAFVSAQQLLDEVVVRFGAEIVTRLDVRQARMLKLFPSAGDSEQAIVDALVNRRLVLAELRRAAVPEPSAERIEAAYRAWQARLPAGSNIPELLAQAGMSEAGLRGWLRDDQRIDGYLADRFSARQGDLETWITVLRQRAGLK